MPPRNQQPDQGDVRQAAQNRRAERDQQEREAEPDPGGAALAVRPEQTMWTARQESALVALGVKGATKADMQVYLHVCARTGLDPFMKQIYMIPRKQWDSFEQREVVKQTIQVGIDGFRVVRDRAEEDGGFFCEFEETVWYDRELTEYGVWLDDAPPAACKVVLVKVMSDGTRLRFPAVLTYNAYVPRKSGKINPTGRWQVDAAHQLEKCCEAFASRRACPQDLGGLFIGEEMEGSTQPPGPGRAARGGKGRGRSSGPVVAEVLKDGHPQAEPPPADPGGPDGDLEPRRVAATRGIMAIFHEHGWAGPDPESHEVRVNVVAALARVSDDDDPLDVESTGKLDAIKAEHTLAELRRFVQAARDAADTDPHEALGELARTVIAWREKQQPAGAKA